ncbi:MAG TPA: CapA family protein, partial [Chthoniobacterales bacterium]|nr:CapA family protein [Chthoniobacterales bacterium]
MLRRDPNDPICLALFGDVMTGRAIDQILPHPGDPVLHEPYIRDARDYVKLADSANGPIPRRVDYEYIWGDMLSELARARTDVRIVNLETSI